MPENQIAEKEVSIKDKISNALDGRSQTWLVEKVREYGVAHDIDVLSSFSDSRLSRKLLQRDSWNEVELKAIGKILKIKLLA